MFAFVPLYVFVFVPLYVFVCVLFYLFVFVPLYVFVFVLFYLLVVVPGSRPSIASLDHGAGCGDGDDGRGVDIGGDDDNGGRGKVGGKLRIL